MHTQTHDYASIASHGKKYSVLFFFNQQYITMLLEHTPVQICSHAVQRENEGHWTTFEDLRSRCQNPLVQKLSQNTYYWQWLHDPLFSGTLGSSPNKTDKNLKFISSNLTSNKLHLILVNVYKWYVTCNRYSSTSLPIQVCHYHSKIHYDWGIQFSLCRVCCSSAALCE